MTKPRQQRKAFHEDLQNALDRIIQGPYIIIAGDLNAWVGDDHIGKAAVAFRNDNGDLLVDICVQNHNTCSCLLYTSKLIVYW